MKVIERRYFVDRDQEDLNVPEPSVLRARCAIAVMAKAPVAGTCKTRLCPPLSPAEAATLSSAFLRDITENIVLAARDARIDPVVAFAPEGTEPLFEGIVAAGTGFVLADGAPIDRPRVHRFGRCLLHAAEALLARGYGAVCLVNSDSPTLPTKLLAQAASYLAGAGDRLVLGPAEDGGYYLIGMNRAHAALFEDIDWSTERVLAQTRERARTLGIETLELRAWYDVDDAASLERVRRDLDGGDEIAFPAPASSRALRTIDGVRTAHEPAYAQRMQACP